MARLKSALALQLPFLVCYPTVCVRSSSALFPSLASLRRPVSLTGKYHPGSVDIRFSRRNKGIDIQFLSDGNPHETGAAP